MDLKTKVIFLYLIIAVIVLILVGVVLPSSLEKQNLDTISDISVRELKYIDFSLTNLISEAKYDINELSVKEVVQTRDDSDFTSFLNASEDTFEYSIGETEQDIIDLMLEYQTTHPYVNSVYMGRENGTFVRSQERARNTAYDPRERPWYILAKENPEEVMVTEPYSSLTTPDINLGVVKALVDQDGEVYGVIGADITLEKLREYINSINTVEEGDIILTDSNGIILAYRNSSYLFTDIEGILQNYTPAFLNEEQGVIFLDGDYFVYYTSPELGWKIGEIFPAEYINQKINESIVKILVYVIITLILLSALTLLTLNYTIIKPISALTAVSRKIAETGDLDQEIDVKGTGEIGSLARSFKAMVDRIETDEIERLEMERQIANAVVQIEENMGQLAILNDEIRNPLTVIVVNAELAPEENGEPILNQAYEIDRIVRQLDREWLSSEKVWSFLRRYYGIDHRKNDDEDSK
ncbi:cache domain-containing protein [Methanolacinia paynteri]|uniref:cache domain-containing protein n=1 Tax=Methanolacinia paynteri TaxID=230356 RepID=UPI0006944B81|nr:cache domain-containing protein [Methanolacinia paynteri]